MYPHIWWLVKTIHNLGILVNPKIATSWLYLIPETGVNSDAFVEGGPAVAPVDVVDVGLYVRSWALRPLPSRFETEEFFSSATVFMDEVLSSENAKPVDLNIFGGWAKSQMTWGYDLGILEIGNGCN